MAFELKNNIICFDLALLESELQELSLLHRPTDVRILCEIKYSDQILNSSFQNLELWYNFGLF